MQGNEFHRLALHYRTFSVVIVCHHMLGIALCYHGARFLLLLTYFLSQFISFQLSFFPFQSFMLYQQLWAGSPLSLSLPTCVR